MSTKRININGTDYLSKNETLDMIGVYSKKKTPILGIDVVSIVDGEVRNDLNKTIWFKSQRGVYKSARTFAMRQMVGEWNWSEIKIGE